MVHLVTVVVVVGVSGEVECACKMGDTYVSPELPETVAQSVMSM